MGWLSQLPIELENVVLDHEAVVNGLDQDMISFSSSIGWGSEGNFRAGGYDRNIFFVPKTESSKHRTGLQWLLRLL